MTDGADKRTALGRAAAIAFTEAAIAAVLFVIIANPSENTLIECAIYKKLHLHCPTCGATRAAYYFFTFRFGKAFYYHAFFTAVSPFAAFVAAGAAVNGIAGKKIVPLPEFRWVYPVVFLAGLLLFGILRNFTATIY